MSDNGEYPQIDALDWSTVQPHVDALLAADLTAATVEPWLLQWSHLEAALSEAGSWIYRAVTENTADEEAEQRFNRFMEEIVPQIKISGQALQRKLLAVTGVQPTRDTAILLRRFRTEVDLFREENVALESKLGLLGNQYNKIVGAMTVEWQGRTETLPQAKSHLEEPDRAAREAIWRLIMQRFLADRQQLNDLFMEMLPLRRQLARNAGLESYRDYRWRQMARFDYTPADCFTYHEAIEHEVVPLAVKLYAELAGKLGVDTLRPWDTKADPYGEPLRPFQQVSELEEGTYRIFQEVDPSLAVHFQAMQDGFLDLESRPNKAPGGYCNEFPVSGKPYIFMNAVGTHDDLATLLHEGGHAFHLMESMDQPLVWNYTGPLEFAEVASMSMELLSAPYLAKDLGGFYDPADARRAYAQQLRETVWFLPYMAVVDAFQHWVYVEAPEDVAPADLDAQWSQLWDRYMQGIDYHGLWSEKETGWQRKGHIFESPFYYIEYGLAQLGALQIWRNALQDQSQAVADYRRALALGYTRSLPELFQAAGARFAFDRETVGELMRLIEEQLAQLEGEGANG